MVVVGVVVVLIKRELTDRRKGRINGQTNGRVSSFNGPQLRSMIGEGEVGEYRVSLSLLDCESL